MTDKEFAKIKPLPPATLNEMADELEGCVSLVTMYCVKSKGGVATFKCNYEGNETLLLNQFMALFRTDDKIGKLAKEAFLNNLHDETVASYKLKDE